MWPKNPGTFSCITVGQIHDPSASIILEAHETYEAREGQHDDLVLALAIALFAGEQFTPVQSW